MTCVSPEGRITPGCTGMWNAEHVAAWRRIVDFVHANSKAKICLQLGHSGRKGSTRLGWEGDDVAARRRQLAGDGGERRRLVAGQPGAAADDARRHGRGARPVRRRGAHGPRVPASTWSSCTPRTAICCRASSPRCRTSAPTNMAAHSKTACATRSKCSPRCAPPGRRTGRCRCASRPPTGRARTASRPTTRSQIGEAFAREGADLIDVSAGQTWTDAQPVYGRMFQTPFSRPDPQRRPPRDHGGRQHLRARPRQLDPRRRPRRPRRARPPAPDRPDVDAARRRRSSITATSTFRRNISTAWPSSRAI